MPAYRDEEGRVQEEETIRPQPAQESAAPSQMREHPDAGPGSTTYEEPTRLVRRPRGDRGAEPSDDVKTRVVGGRRRRRRDAEDGAAERPDPMHDPLAGWLVVTRGPGKGSAVPLGSGTNTIGRGGTARARVDFGDDQISRSAHVIVTYDPRNRDWYVERGHGTNLAYLGGRPVLQPTPLEPHTQIQIGATSLRFVPLCTEGFDWQDIAEEDQ